MVENDKDFQRRFAMQLGCIGYRPKPKKDQKKRSDYLSESVYFGGDYGFKE